MLKAATIAALGVVGTTSAAGGCWENKNQAELGLKLGADTVDTLDVNSYVRHWFHMYADPLELNTIEPDALCVTADYAMQEDGTISMHNYQTTARCQSGSLLLACFCLIVWLFGCLVSSKPSAC
jgi:hypothetical protein